MTPIKKKFGVLAKWKLIMCRLGVKAARVALKIVKCYAKPIIEQKGIGKILKVY